MSLCESREMSSQSSPRNDDQVPPPRVSGRKHPGDLSRFGVFKYPVQWYYQYTVMTGVYMLGTVETLILHLAYVLGIYFLYTYVWTFIRDLEVWSSILKY